MEILTSSEAVRLAAYVPTRKFDDGGDAALHRPQSWEWQLEGAARARGRLETLGYHDEQDPNAPHRRRWVRP